MENFMNTFSKTALLSVAMLASGSVFAGNSNATIRFIEFCDAAQTAAESVHNAARAVWTPSFVRPVWTLVQAEEGTASRVSVASNSRRRAAYRTALVSAVVLPVAYAVYKKYGKAIAAKYNSVKKAFNSKFAKKAKSTFARL